MECSRCHAIHDDFRLRCKSCGRTIRDRDQIVLYGPETEVDPPWWHVHSDAVRRGLARGELAATIPPSPTYKCLLESRAVFDDVTVEVNASLRASAPDRAAGFSLDLRRHGTSSYRADALYSGLYRVCRLDEGENTTLASVRAPALAVTLKRCIYFSAIGDRLQLAVDGQLLLSLRDCHHEYGTTRVLAVPGDAHSIELEWSKLTLALRR